MSIAMFVLSAGLGLVGTWLSMPLAHRLGIIDKPGFLKPHAKPTPRFGGIGVGLGAVGGTLIGSVFVPGVWSILLPLMIGTLTALGTGALDDVVSLRPRHKILGQAVGGVLLAALGLPAVPVESRLMGSIATLPLMVLMSNAVNLIDGMDGLAGGTSLIMSLGFWMLGTIWHDPVLQGMAAALAGGCAGFLVFNLPPARTFMGDAGSLFLGAWFVAMVARAAEGGSIGHFVTALMLLTVPLYDTGVGIVRRWIGRKPLFAGDRDHVYDQLLRRTKSRWVTIALMWAFTAVVVACTLLGIALSVWPLLGGLVAGLLILTWQQGFLFPAKESERESS